MSFALVNASGKPVLFTSYFLFFTFLLLAFDCVCMAGVYGKRKAREGCPLRLFLSATIVFVFHLVLCGFSFQYSMLFETVPGKDIFAQIGAFTWLFVTPFLYLASALLFAVLCIYQWMERRGAERGDLL